jgi:hypothetical protein
MWINEKPRRPAGLRFHREPNVLAVLMARLLAALLALLAALLTLLAGLLLSTTLLLAGLRIALLLLIGFRILIWVLVLLAHRHTPWDGPPLEDM